MRHGAGLDWEKEGDKGGLAAVVQVFLVTFCCVVDEIPQSFICFVLATLVL